MAEVAGVNMRMMGGRRTAGPTDCCAILEFMAYHETFWLAVATTAPVIALAATVSMSDILKLAGPDREVNKPSSPELPPGRQEVLWAMVLCTANLLTQLVILWNALDSIASGTDRAAGISVIVWAEPVGIALLLAVAWINISAREKIRKIKPTDDRVPGDADS